MEKKVYIYKVWVIGNGGMPHEPEYHVFDSKIDEDYEQELCSEALYGECYGVRGAECELVDNIPQEYVYKAIRNYENRISNAIYMIQLLKSIPEQNLTKKSIDKSKK